MTKFDKAVRDFPIGCKVKTETTRPEWSPDTHADRVVCGHVRFRDSDDDPSICVTLVSVTGAVAGWFNPENLKRVK